MLLTLLLLLDLLAKLSRWFDKYYTSPELPVLGLSRMGIDIVNISQCQIKSPRPMWKAVDDGTCKTVREQGTNKAKAAVIVISDARPHYHPSITC